jgi:HAD superfamily hydrolase (TIGR01509 family)
MHYPLKLIVCFIFVLAGGDCLLQDNTPYTRFQAIIFDCDGVLVDTEYLKFLAWKEALETQGVSFSIKEYRSLVGHSSKNILQMIQKAKNIDISEDVIKFKNTKYKYLQKQGVPPIPEMVNFVLRLFEARQQLGIRLALASSAPKEEILLNLKQIGLEDVFDLIISGSDDLKGYIDAEGTNKPKPYIYIEAAKRLGKSPEFCLVFEDTKAGVDAAVSAGMVAIAVPNQFTLTHDFGSAQRIVYSYKEFASFDFLTHILKKR